jgi:gliding motility-associated-like protein
MNTFYKLLNKVEVILPVVAAMALIPASGKLFSQTTTFNYTGAVQYYTVPPNVFCIDVDVRGAKGGGANGGNGARITTTLTVTPGQVLEVYVGGQGTCGSNSGGWNGGGTGHASTNGNSNYNSCGGGGASDIRVGGSGLANRVVVAGGGGGRSGGSGPVAGGAANCPNGAAGGNTYGQGGGGGTQFAGGNGGAPWAGTPPGGSPGALGVGGQGGPWQTASGGGGGGGYYGGGGGGNDGCCTGANGGGGGGGGSSFGGACTPATNSGNGIVTITVTDLPEPIVSNQNICGGNVATITPSNSPSGIYNFYADANGTTLLSQGASYTTPPLNQLTTYWVASFVDPCISELVPVIIDMNPNPNASLVFDNTVCIGTNAAFDASGSTPVAPAVITGYSWDFTSDGVVDVTSPNNPNATFNYPAPGNYNVTFIVSSTGGCADTLQMPIQILDLPVADFTWPALLCGTTFSLDGSASLAVAPQNITTYNWDFDGDGIYEAANAGATPSNTFPATGNNTVGLQVVTNEACVGSVTQVINIPAALVVNITGTTDVTCFGANDGTATAVASGGTGPLDYSWNTNPVQNTDIATGLGAGTFTVTVTDAANCSVTADATINEGPQLTLNLTNTINVTCNGLSNGSLIVDFNGGTGAINYSWDTNPVQNTATAINLPAGTYTVTATDANNCIATLTASVTEPPLLTASANSTDIICFGGNNGTLSGVPGGGTLPYTSQGWNTVPPTVGANAINVPAGTYTYTVTDANGCVATANATVVEPPEIILSTSVIDVNCPNASTGSATVNIVSGAVGAVNIQWNTNPVQNTGTAQNLPAGNYSVLVTDANGCTANANVTLTTLSLPFQFTAAITDVVCGGDQNGAINLNITQGSGPYQFAWVPNNATTQNIANLSGGNYSVVVTDINGCQWPSSFLVNEPPVLTVNPTVVDLKCFGESTGQIKINAAGGTLPYSYAWNGIPGGATYSNLPAGNYNGVVTDANGCTANATITLVDPPQITIDYTPEYEINIAQEVTLYTNPQGGTGALTISWSPDVNLSCSFCATPDASPVRNTRYTITVTDENQCTLSQDIMVYVNKVGPFIPSAFTPNGDKKNENFRVIVYGISEFMMRIYDRWGNLVYITDDVYSGWDGNIGSAKAEPGTYAYRVDMKYIDGKEANLFGNVMLVR